MVDKQTYDRMMECQLAAIKIAKEINDETAFIFAKESIVAIGNTLFITEMKFRKV